MNSNLKIGLVVSEFNREITERLETGAHQQLMEKGLQPSQIQILRVPGAYEIPLAAQALFESGVDGVVALGAVIRGETDHYDFICSSVERGCTLLQIKWQRPLTFGVLMTLTEDQAWERVGGRHGHKGREAAATLLTMLQLLRGVQNVEKTRTHFKTSDVRGQSDEVLK